MLPRIVRASRVTGLLIAVLMVALAVPASRVAAAPLLGVDRPNAIADRYIVVWRDGTTSAGTMSGRALDAIRRQPEVAYVAADTRVRISSAQTPVAWNLDRIDQRSGTLDQSYSYDRTGAGVTVYVIDTGINTSHVEFEGRAAGGFSTVSDGRGTQDCNGHGTHVAGSVGGRTYGVAKGVQIVAVRVLGCDGYGTASGVIAGIDWVTEHHAPNAVANISLDGDPSPAFDAAVRRSIASGVTFITAAGNMHADACGFSPARVPEAITVGGSTWADTPLSFSNYGRCVDLFAPGMNVRSSWAGSDTASNTISGTSMAVAHVAGVAAMYLERYPGAAPAAVQDAVVSAATPDVMSGVVGGSPNRLLYSGVP